MLQRPILAITMGDPAGVGPEIAFKALQDPKVYEDCIPVVVGESAALARAAEACGRQADLRPVASPKEAVGKPGAIELIDLGLLAGKPWAWGQVDPLCGDIAFRCVERAIQLALKDEVHAVVTGPLNKEAMNLAGHHYAGHTEIFAALTGTKQVGMLLTSPTLRVIHVTTHVAMRQACDLVTTERVLKTIRLARQAMEMLGIERPRIAVAGLNAHCSENGLFGDEEEKWIAPAVRLAQGEGILAEGPLPPDTVFVKAMGGQYDIVVAMYHDQGHIPLKLSGFKMDPATGAFTSVSGVNTTIGLPIIRTSVDHGTAFDKAGKGVANEESLKDAVRMAVVMARHKFSL